MSERTTGGGTRSGTRSGKRDRRGRARPKRQVCVLRTCRAWQAVLPVTVNIGHTDVLVALLIFSSLPHSQHHSLQLPWFSSTAPVPPTTLALSLVQFPTVMGSIAPFAFFAAAAILLVFRMCSILPGKTMPANRQRRSRTQPCRTAIFLGSGK